MPTEPRTIPKERITPIPESDFSAFTKRCLARAAIAAACRFYRDPENRKKFEEWYFATYGKPYVWKHYYSDTSEDTDHEE